MARAVPMNPPANTIRNESCETIVRRKAFRYESRVQAHRLPDADRPLALARPKRWWR